MAGKNLLTKLMPKGKTGQMVVLGGGAAAAAVIAGWFYYDSTMKPTGIASPSLSPPTVAPNAYLSVRGTFVNKDSQPTFALFPKWYVYRLEGQSRHLVAQGDIPWFSSDFQFAVPTTGFTDAEYVIVLSDAAFDILQGAGSVFKPLPGAAETAPSEIGTFNLPGGISQDAPPLY